jgi:hypothetical protein
MQEERLPKLIMEWIPGKEEKEDVQKNVDGRCTSSHGNKTSRSRSVVKQKGMVSGFRKTATGVVGPKIDFILFYLFYLFHFINFWVTFAKLQE